MNYDLPRNTTVDRPSRRQTPASVSSSASYERDRESRDRSPSPFRHGRDRSRSPFRHKRDQSRSPYSHPPPRASSPRGQKRHNDFHERPDNRRHKTHYEDDRLGYRSKSYRDGDQRSRVSYADLDDPRRDRNSQRSYNKHRDNKNQPNKSRDGYGYQDHNNKFQSVKERGSNSFNTPTRSRADKHVQKHQRELPKAVTDAQRTNEIGLHRIAETPKEETVDAPQSEYTTPAVEDNASIEAIRAAKKAKRDAIRARHAAETASQPLLQQVLLGNASEATTPNIASPAGLSEKSISPPLGSPLLDSMPASPAELSAGNEEGSQDQILGEKDGPSAADYDPMKDMEDDRVRAMAKLNQSELSSSAYDENDSELRATLIPASQIDPPKNQKKEYDMFADDDYDMFASDDDQDGQNGTSKATTIPRGRRLDRGMLDNWDDEQGYYKIIKDELLDGDRYCVVTPLGKGVYANVVRAHDNVGHVDVAIKIVRKNDAMKKAGYKEMGFLKKLNEADIDDKRYIVRFQRSFEHKGHLCMVFEHLDKNLRDMLKTFNGGHGLSFSAVKRFAFQMFWGLEHMKHCHIIHADLKPDNILASHDGKSVKICDFGTAADQRDNNEVTQYLVSRFYRAPEIILGMKVDYAIDMWSIGCTLYELWTGKILFTGENNNQMLKSMMEIRGPFSLKNLKKGENAGLYFNENGLFRSVEKDKTGKVFSRIITPKKPNRDLKSRIFDAAKGITTDAPTTTELTQFADLLDRCLNLNAEKRITPHDALKHAFFSSGLKTGNTAVNKFTTTRATVIKPGLVRRGPPSMNRSK
ncbi:kinase-like protein [Zopfia rhizophila CBS 207.26]|uniref:non-specific serine/threonine protein kinase n=1 Tax=Zopfia rhizophila CBS 207.26 TaxID=1314779 RepID=A0A6A6EI21_9PEZI|nr:kinase-like protein [Zopfia rhizophila CBS 207.26]